MHRETSCTQHTHLRFRINGILAAFFLALHMEVGAILGLSGEINYLCSDHNKKTESSVNNDVFNVYPLCSHMTDRLQLKSQR